MTLRKIAKKSSHLSRKWVFGAISGTVTPPDFSHRIRGGFCEGMKHGENRGCPDTGAEQDNRSIAWKERKVTSRRAHLKQVTGPNPVVKVLAACAGGTLHADAIP